MLVELARREKEANIKPDPDVDIYMKVGRNLLSITTFGSSSTIFFLFFFYFLYFEKGLCLSRLMRIRFMDNNFDGCPCEFYLLRKFVVYDKIMFKLKSSKTNLFCPGFHSFLKICIVIICHSICLFLLI